MLDDKGRVIPIPGKRVEFTNHKYYTNDPETIEFLHNHPARGSTFEEIQESEVANVQKQIAAVTAQVVTGPNTTAIRPEGQVEVPKARGESRPEDKAAISPEIQDVIVRTIDDRIGKAMGEIVALLKKDKDKEEKVIAGLPRKTFKCPYCGEVFPSSFHVGKHKKVCSKKPQ
jgi:hypothetical protein